MDAHLMTVAVKYSSTKQSPANSLTDRRSDSNLTDTPDGVYYYKTNGTVTSLTPMLGKVRFYIL